MDHPSRRRATPALAALIVALAAVAAGAAEPAPSGPAWPAVTAITLPTDAQTATGADPLFLFGPAVALRSISCTSPGDCVGVGGYGDTNGDDDYQALYATESAGVWGTAQRLSLPDGANATPTGQRAFLASVSCPSAGNCVAVGSFADAAGDSQAMIATDTAGSWGAHELTLPAGAYATQGMYGASLTSVSCTSVGNCLAVGSYVDSTHARQAMLVEEDGGVWGVAKTLKLPANAVTAPGGQYARLTSVSCTPPATRVLAIKLGPVGSCAAVGTYVDNGNPGNLLTVVAAEINKVWTGTELELPPDSDAVQPLELDTFESPAVSCTSAGNCVAVGSYDPGAGSAVFEPMQAAAVNGTWGRAAAVAVPAASDGSEVQGALYSVTCASPGSCVAVGLEVPVGTPGVLPMVASEVNGSWGVGDALALPSDAVEPSGQQIVQGGQLDYLSSVACTSATACVASGAYSANTGQRAMVVSTVPPPAIATTALPPGVVGSPYHGQVKATGGDGNYAWMLATGALPSGLTLNPSTGVISGTPTATGTSSFRVTVSDADLVPAGWKATAELSIAITARSSSSGGGGGTGTQPGSASIAKVKVGFPKVTASISCAGTAGESCTGALALSAVEHLSGHRITAITASKKKTRTVALGRVAYTVTAGASATVKIKLNATAKTLLSGHHRFRARLALTATARTTATATRTITLAR